MRRQNLLVRLKCLAIMLLFTHFAPWAMAQDSGSSAAEWVEITLKYAPRDSRSAISAIAYHNGQKVTDQLTRGAAFTIRIPKSLVPPQSSIGPAAIEDLLKRAINQNYAFHAATIVSLGDRRPEPSLPNEKFLRVQDILSAANKSELRWIGNEGESDVATSPASEEVDADEVQAYQPAPETAAQLPPSACLECASYNRSGRSAQTFVDQILSQSIQEKHNYYSKSLAVQSLINLGKRKPLFTPEKPMCYQHVKKMLQRSGLVDTYLVGVNPKNAGPALEAQGYKNIFDPESPAPFSTPKDAPQGAVLVYEPYPNRNQQRCLRSRLRASGRITTKCSEDPGHIEVKLGESGQGGFASQFRGENSRTGDQLIRGNRKLIGIYVK